MEFLKEKFKVVPGFVRRAAGKGQTLEDTGDLGPLLEYARRPVTPRKRSFEQFEEETTKNAQTPEQEGAGSQDKEQSPDGEIHAASDGLRSAELYSAGSQTESAQSSHSEPNQPEFPVYRGARLGTSISFDGEALEDYTYGLPRMTRATDGFRPCAALLMTMELSSKIQAALNARQMLEDRRMYTEERHAELARMDEQGLGDSEQRAELNAKIKRLDNELVQARLEQEQLQIGVDNILYDVFEESGLIAAAAEQPGSAQAEVPVVLDQLDPAEYSSLDVPPPLEHEDVQAPTNEDLVAAEQQRAFQEANANRVTAAIAKLTAQERFDNWRAEYDYDRAEYYQAMANGEPTMPKEEFDHLHLKKKMELTSQLIEAEKAYKAAKVEGKQVGLWADRDQTSDFVDIPDDGYGEEWDLYVTKHAPRDRIENWLEDVPEKPERPQSSDGVQIDEWDANLENFDFSDSLSCKDYQQREKIDGWRQTAERAFAM